jgi:hypothetical protein
LLETHFRYRVTVKVFTEDRPTRFDLFRVAYPDTGESGDAYDIDVRTGPIRRTWLEFRVPSRSASILLLDTVESA